jgi:N-acetylmuramoyl-L-alanine amidase
MPAWTGDPIWLKDVLAAVKPKLKLAEIPGWDETGHGDFADIRGVVVHHTGNSRETAQSIYQGRPDLEGPLSNLHIAPDGTVTLVAVGVCWHAGRGSYPWLPTDNANQHMIGIECAWPTIRPDGSFNPAERWPDAQIIAMRDVCAALVKRLGFGADRVIGHKEWAGSAQGKWDPGNIDMRWFRGEVTKALRGDFERPQQPGPILPPDYAKETWEQLRAAWPQLGNQTLVNALAEIRDAVCGTSDKDKR